MILKDISEECKSCANLKAWNIHIDNQYDYRCEDSQKFISKDLHREPCEKFEEKLDG